MLLLCFLLDSVLKLKEEIFKVTGIPIKRQILLMATLNSSIVTAGSDASASSLSNSTDNNHLHKNNDRNEHLFYTVPKDSLLQQDMSENDNEKHRYVYLFDRDENETGCDDGMIDVMDIIQRIRHIQGANEAAWGNYLYHKQNFLKLEQTFSNEFLQYDAEKSQPILTPSSSQIFHEDIAKRTNVIKLDQCITDFFGNEYKNLYDTIPIEKIVQWHEFCNQSRDILCGKYYEVHSFAESLNMDTGSTCSIDTGSLSETTAEMHSRHDMLRIYNSVRQQLSQNLSRIKDFQTVLRSSMNTINFLKDAMNKHSEHLEYLRIVINWPEGKNKITNPCCLLFLYSFVAKIVFQEISRELQRRVSYSSSLQERFSELEKIQGQEISKRQEFISNYRSKCMPLFADIICQMPPPLQFPHKEKLPAFDVSFEQKSLSKISNMEEEINRLKQENTVLLERLAVANQSNRKVIELEQQVSSKCVYYFEPFSFIELTHTQP